MKLHTKKELIKYVSVKEILYIGKCSSFAWESLKRKKRKKALVLGEHVWNMFLDDPHIGGC